MYVGLRVSWPVVSEPVPAEPVFPEGAVLGATVRHPVDHLDIILTDTTHLTGVTFQCDEVASMCPVTEQPDLSAITIAYRPRDGRVVESKSLKLYLWGFRDRGVLCEGMAQEIARRVWTDAQPHDVTVTVRQTARGGIVTTAVAAIDA